MSQETSKDIKKRAEDNCPECNSSNLIHDYDTGETICGQCGLVLQERMVDRGPEWRAFTQEEKVSRSRVGLPSLYTVHDKGLSTAIGPVDRDAFGRKLPLSTRSQMWRLRKQQIRSRVHSSIDRNLAQAMAELGRLSDKLYVPGPVKEKAAVIYRKAVKKRLTRGRNISVIVTGSLYAALRITETPRTLKEIVEASPHDKKEVTRAYRSIVRKLDLKMPVKSLLDYVSKIAEKTGISGETQGYAIEILEQAKRKRIPGGKDPMGMSGAALYIACLQNNEKKTQKDIAEAAGVTEVTIRNRYKSLKRELSLSIPDPKSTNNPYSN